MNILHDPTIISVFLWFSFSWVVALAKASGRPPMAKEAAHLDGPELCALAYRKQHDALRQYLEAHPKAVVDQRHPGGWTPLMVAGPGGAGGSAMWGGVRRGAMRLGALRHGQGSDLFPNSWRWGGDS